MTKLEESKLNTGEVCWKLSNGLVFKDLNTALEAYRKLVFEGLLNKLVWDFLEQYSIEMGQDRTEDAEVICLFIERYKKEIHELITKTDTK